MLKVVWVHIMVRMQFVDVCGNVDMVWIVVDVVEMCVDVVMRVVEPATTHHGRPPPK